VVLFLAHTACRSIHHSRAGIHYFIVDVYHGLHKLAASTLLA